MLNIVFLASLTLAALLIISATRPSGLTATLLSFFLSSTGVVVMSGYILSAMNVLHRLNAWAMIMLIIPTLLLLGGIRVRLPSLPRNNTLQQWLGCPLTRLLLLPMLITTVALAGLNLIVVIATAPHNWDSMTYHLPRVAYFLQHANVNPFHANYWAQVIHAKNGSLLVLATYLISGYHDHLTQLVQFVAYGVATLSVYGVARTSGHQRAAALFAALTFALLIESLMQATIVNNDMLLAAYTGSALFFLMQWRYTNQPLSLVWAAVALALASGTKASYVLVLPVMLAIFLGLLPWRDALRCRQALLTFVAASTISMLLFVLPAGYLDNWRMFGHPVGPEGVRRFHSFEGSPPNDIMTHGARNVMRFGIHFVALDGLPPLPAAQTAQTLLRTPPRLLFETLGFDLENPNAVIRPFSYDRPPRAHENFSYWGILGFALLWPVLFLALVGVLRAPAARLLALGTLLFLVLQAYAGPYDPWRGRYFVIAAVIAAPLAAMCLSPPPRHWLIRAYLIFVVVFGCISAWSAVLLRDMSPLITHRVGETIQPSIFTLTRTEQLMRERPIYLEAVEAYETLVPSDAIVALALHGDSYEYPLFGHRLTRTLIPINSWWDGLQPIPPTAEYLLYEHGLVAHHPDDLHLGQSWYLRQLTAPPASHRAPSALGERTAPK